MLCSAIHSLGGVGTVQPEHEDFSNFRQNCLDFFLLKFQGFSEKDEQSFEQNRGPRKEYSEIMVGMDRGGVPEYGVNGTFFDPT